MPSHDWTDFQRTTQIEANLIRAYNQQNIPIRLKFLIQLLTCLRRQLLTTVSHVIQNSTSQSILHLV